MSSSFINIPLNNGQFWGEPVATAGDLPASGVEGEVRIAIDTQDGYMWDGAAWVPAFGGGGGGSGDVTGPASSVNNQAVLFNGTTGKDIKASTATGVAKLASGVLSASDVDLTSEVTGVLPVANGGTNSSASLNNNRVMVSSGGAVTEASAITGQRALASNASGLPVASATTDTELGYVSGVTSAIQTQLNAKQPTGNYLTDLTGDVAATGPGSAAATIQSGAVTNAKIASAAGISLDKLAALTASRAAVSDGSGFLSSSATTATEVGYLSGVTSALQTQLDGKLSLSGGTMTGSLVLDADPTLALGAATKQYVDNVAAGLSPRAAVFVATTADISLSGEQTIDGVLTSASRVLVKNQAAQQQNGIYVSAAGAWARAADMNSWFEVPGAFTFVEQGSTQADTGWVCTSDSGGTINVTAITFVQFSGAGEYTASGQGITLTGNLFAFQIDGSTLSQSLSGAKVATGGITNTEVNASAAVARSKLASGNANRLVSNDGSGVMADLAAITVSRALASDANGLPVASATTDTELGYVSGVTSAIQTQLDGKQATGSYITALTGDVTASGPGSAAATLADGTVTNAKVASGAAIAVDKLAAVTASRALESDASGFVQASTVTSTELGYVSGVTSSIQTQLDSKEPTVALPTSRFVLSDPTTGALFTEGSWAYDANIGYGAVVNLNYEPNDANAGFNFQNFGLTLRPLQDSPNDSFNNLNVQLNVDPDSSGFDIGTNGSCGGLINLGFNHQGTSDIGSLNAIFINGNLGNGTDPISIKGFSYASTSLNVNDNVTLNGNSYGYTFQPSVAAGAFTTSGASFTAFLDGANIQTPLLASYNSANFGPNLAELGANQNYTGVSIQPNIAAFNNGASVNGLSISGTYTGMGPNSGWQGVNINPTVTNARYAAGINVSMDNVTTFVGSPSTLVFQDLTYTFLANGDNNVFTLEYTPGATAGNEVVTVGGNAITIQIESGVSTANQIRTAALASALATAVNVTVSGTGSNAQVTAGPTNFGGGVNDGRKQAAYLDGDVEITGSLAFNGDLNVARISAFYQYNLTNGGGQPSSGQSLITSPTVPASATLTSADTLGVNTAALINIGAGATVGTAFLGVAALGLPAVLTMGAGSTLDRCSGAIFALSLDAGAGGGTVDTVALCRSMALPNGVTTVNRLYGYEVALPFGDPGTDTWGLYAATAPNNWMEGSLLVGGAALTDDKVANTSVGVEIRSTTKALLPSRLTTTERDALTAIDGMLIYNTTTNQHEGYQNGAWTAFGATTGPLQLPSYTTTARDLLTPAAGMMIYNTTVDTMQVYVGGSVNDWVDSLGWGATVG